jgi:hypothetical protein
MRRALVVGCGTFDDPELAASPHAEADAQDVHAQLIDPDLGEFAPDSPLLLNPSKAELRSAVTSFMESMEAGDVFVFFLAGHAGTLASREWFYLCRDTKSGKLTLTAFAWEDFQGFLKKCPAQGILIVDTCYSRAIIERKKTLGACGAPDSADFQNFDAGTSFLFSSGPDDLALEGEGHGMLTSWLLRGLSEGAGLPSENAFVSPADLFLWMQRRLRRAGLSQKLWPQFRNSGNVEGLYLARNPKHGMDHNDGARWSDEQGIDIETSNLVARLGLSRDSAAAQHERLRRVAEQLSSTHARPWSGTSSSSTSAGMGFLTRAGYTSRSKTLAAMP